MFKRCFFILFVALQLTACGPKIEPPVIAKNPELTWAQHQAKMRKVNTWLVKGKSGIISPKKSLTANLLYKKQAKKYLLRLSGPMGQGAVHIIGHPRQVVLQRSDGKKIIATNAHDLLMQEFGWDLPINNLDYWVRGLPAKTVVQNYTLNNYGYLKTLQQENWIVSFSDYQLIKKHAFPTRLTITSPGFKLKLVKLAWEF